MSKASRRRARHAREQVIEKAAAKAARPKPTTTAKAGAKR